MKLIRNAACVITLAVAAPLAMAQGVIKIGDVNAYKCAASHLDYYRQGMALAVDEINASGGIDGKKLEVITRDDNCNPANAVRAAQELVTQEKVNVLSGSFLSNVALALSDFAKHNKIFFLATLSLSDAQVWQHGNPYSFRMRAGTYELTNMMVDQAAKLNKRRWALVYPNYEFGQLAARDFKQLLKAKQPDVQFVAEEAPPLFKLNGAEVAQALEDAKPDGIFNVLFASDLLRFVRAGKLSGLFHGRTVLGLVTGEPANLAPLKKDTPVGWIVTGYNPLEVKTPEHQIFLKNYQARFKELPRLSSVFGYIAIKSIAAGLEKAGSVNTDSLITAFHGLHVETPFGGIKYRAVDNTSTLGAFVGRTAYIDGKGIMIDSRYLDGADYEPPLADVKKWRQVN